VFGVGIGHSVSSEGFLEAVELFGGDFARGLSFAHHHAVRRSKLAVEAINFGGGDGWRCRVVSLSLLVKYRTS